MNYEIKKRGDSTKAKTHIRIGLWGAVFLMGYYILNIGYQWPFSLSKRWDFYIFGFPLVALMIYILSVIRKDLKTVKIIFGIWQIFAVVILFFIAIILGLVVISSGEVNYKGVYKGILIIFLYYTIPYGFSTLIIWMGLRGLQRIIEAENELKVENTSQIEEK